MTTKEEIEAQQKINEAYFKSVREFSNMLLIFIMLCGLIVLNEQISTLENQLENLKRIKTQDSLRVVRNVKTKIDNHTLTLWKTEQIN